MPFQSEAQRRFMFARHPEIAQRWAHEYGSPKDLPEHVAKTDDRDYRERVMKRLDAR